MTTGRPYQARIGAWILAWAAFTAPPAAADFTAEPTSGVEGLAVQFQSLVDGAAFFLWSFGDGGTLSAGVPAPVHVYQQPGVYSVSVTIISASGAGTFTKAGLIEILPASMAPAFSAQGASGPTALTVSFADETTGDAPQAWLWDFGDGQTSTEQHPTHTYLVPGSYDVSLTVTRASATETLVQPGFVQAVSPELMQPGLSALPVQGRVPLAVQFDGHAAGQQPTSWHWDFGDGATSSAVHPLHVYHEAGEYTVTLRTEWEWASEVAVEVGLIRVAPSTFDLAPPLLLPAVTGLRHVAMGDVTGDGLPDVVAAGSGLVTWVHQGGLEFAPPQVHALSQAALGLDLADLDLDGRQDAVLRLTGTQHTAAAFLADGSGSWTPSWSGERATTDLALGDFDGDGLIDLVVGVAFEWPLGGELRLASGDGRGGFEPSVSVLQTGFPGRFTVTDVNGDGHLDLVWFHETWSGNSFVSSVGLGNGSGRLVQQCFDYIPGVLTLPTYGSSAVGDVTGDGLPDWVAVIDPGCDWFGGTWNLVVGASNGTCLDKADSCGQPALSGVLRPTEMAVAELDLRGAGDLVTLGQGPPWAMTDHLLRVHLNAQMQLGGARTFDPGIAATALAVGDLDLDGLPDLVLVGPTHSALSILRNLTTPSGFVTLEGAISGLVGTPQLAGAWLSAPEGDVLKLTLSQAAPSAPTTLVLGFSQLALPYKGGLLVPSPDVLLPGLTTSAAGELHLSARWPAELGPGFSFWTQAWITDAAAPAGFAASNGLFATLPE